MMRFVCAGLGIATAALLCGCFQATHLAYVYEADVGLDVAYSQEGSGRVVFGYDRNTFALVPQRGDAVGPCPGDGTPAGTAAVPATGGTVTARENESDKGELMTLTAISLVEADGLNDVSIDHFVATGDAALRVSKDHAGLKQIRRSIFSEEAR